MSAASTDNDVPAPDSASGHTLPVRSTTSVPHTRSGQKLRDCCQSCAKSKVRCTKEKPTCSRCEAKGIPCRYLQSKRPGRIPGSSRRAANLSNDGLTGVDAREVGGVSKSSHIDSTPEAFIANTSLSPTSTTLAGLAPDCAHHGATIRLDGFQSTSDLDTDLNLVPSKNMDGGANVPFIWDECFDVLLASMDDPMYTNLMDWDSTATALNMDLSLGYAEDGGLPACDGMEQTATSSLLPDTSQVISAAIDPALAPAIATSSTSSSTSCASSTTSLTAPTSDSSSPPLLPDAEDLVARNTSSATSSKESVQAKSVLSYLPQDESPESSNIYTCNCLTKALDLLKAVAQEPSRSKLSQSPGEPTTQAILAKNKETIHSTLELLTCTFCMDDRLLIMVALLIAMKMLPRYASAAALTQPASHVGDSVKAYRRDSVSHTMKEHPYDTDFLRRAKQQVLRELHLVQRLISQLSSRLKTLSSQGSTPGAVEALPEPMPIAKSKTGQHNSQSERLRNSSSPTLGDTESLPISNRTLDLVEEDVRSSLSSLSATVRNALKSI